MRHQEWRFLASSRVDAEEAFPTSFTWFTLAPLMTHNFDLSNDPSWMATINFSCKQMSKLITYVSICVCVKTSCVHVVEYVQTNPEKFGIALNVEISGIFQRPIFTKECAQFVESSL